MDDNLIVIPKKHRIPCVGFEYKTIIDGERIYFILFKDEFSVAYDKKYIDTEEPYFPIRNFLVLSIYVLVLFVLMFYCLYNYEDNTYAVLCAVFINIGAVIYSLFGGKS